MQSLSAFPVDRPVSSAADLVAAIEERILGGALAAGDRLPPVRAASTELGLAANTVASAYRRLAERGLVYGDGRRGTVVADRSAGELPMTRPLDHRLADLSSGNPDRALLPDLNDAIKAIRLEPVAYGSEPIDGELARVLGADLAADLPQIGVIEAGRNLAVVGGALDGIERVLMAHLRHGDRVAVEDPGYPSVLNLIKALSLRPVPLPIDTQGPTADGLAQAIEQGAAAMVVTPRAQNPSGAAVTVQRAEELRAILAERPELLVIEDDHAGPIAGAPHHSIIEPGRPRWAMIRSVAKSLGPDLRLAGLAGDDTTVGRVINRQLLGTGWVSHLLQRTAAHLLASPETPGRFRRAAETYRQRRAIVLGGLAARGITAGGDSGLNVWIPVSDEAHVVAGMQQEGFAVLAGTRFRQRSGPAIRLSTGTADVAVLADAASALAGLLETGRSPRSV